MVLRSIYTFIFLLSGFHAFSQDSVKVYKAEIGLAYGSAYPSKERVDKTTTITLPPLRRYAFNLNYELYRYNSKAHLSLGVRILYFQSTVNIANATKQPVGVVSIGAPFRFNYSLPLFAKTELLMGTGILLCAQPRGLASEFPFRLYGEIFAGIRLGKRFILTTELSSGLINYVLNYELMGNLKSVEFNITGIALDVRYIIIHNRYTKSKKSFKPQLHPLL